MFKRIAVALDGSECSRQAFEVALELASEQGAVLGICSVAEPAFGAEAARQTVADAMLAARARGVTAVGEARSGAAAREVIKYAEHFNAGAIVMGTHGRHGFKRLVQGSVAEAVLSKACVPIVLVREKRALFQRSDVIKRADASLSKSRA